MQDFSVEPDRPVTKRYIRSDFYNTEICKQRNEILEKLDIYKKKTKSLPEGRSTSIDSV